MGIIRQFFSVSIQLQQCFRSLSPSLCLSLCLWTKFVQLTVILLSSELGYSLENAGPYVVLRLLKHLCDCTVEFLM